MKKKLVWLVVSGLTILSLVLAACAPAVTEEKKKEEVVTKKEVVMEEKGAPIAGEELVANAAGKLVRKPRYGGSITIAIQQWVYNFDEAYGQSPSMFPNHLTNDELLEGDWAKGLNGSGEATFRVRTFTNEFWRGHLAESWELPNNETQIYHIRKGIRFYEKPGVMASREMDAYDVAYSLERVSFSPVSFHGLNYPPAGGQSILSATATDKWTVVVKTPPNLAGYLLPGWGDMITIIAPEVIKKFGDMKDWTLSHGTGPFILTDYVEGNMMTFKKNPNYWQKDPLHPENQLPYVDSVKLMIIPDKSTALAALRTAKLDIFGAYAYYEVVYDDWDSLLRTHPKLKWSRAVSGAGGIAMRVDKPELPWYDIRVRRALWLAVDHQGIKDKYYSGAAELITTFAAPIIEYKDFYIPLEEYPPEIQELYGYYPEKAKQLLKEAGYPSGFKAELILQTKDVDLASVVKAYWADIGVDLQLQPKEPGAFTAINLARSHSQMLWAGTIPYNPHNQHHYRYGVGNKAFVSDPILDENFRNTMANLNWNMAEFAKAVKAQQIRAHELVPYMYLPAPYVYTVWWPWMANYNGESDIGYLNYPAWVKYLWVDQELKKETLAKR